MKTGPILTLSLAALLAGGCVAPLQAAAEGRPALAGNPAIPSPEAWADVAALEKQLAASILKSLKGAEADEVHACLRRPQNRLALALWHIAHCERAVDTSKHTPAKEGETLPPRSMKELLASADAGTLAFIRQFTGDLAWVEQFAYSGECLNPGRALAILDAIRREREAQGKAPLTSDRVLRNVATATALEWARSGWDFHKALARARFYMDNYEARRFHKGFRDLPFWQYRVICGCKGDNANGSVASLEWALDNVHLPVDQYPGCCWQASYLSSNLFGESIHGAWYYAPYNDVYGENAVQRTLDVGGVCGSLSHFGAFAALANGVPALAAGEPGHCAYIVCVNGRWTPAYSLSWERGLHWQVWNGIYKYSSLHMATELYSPEQAEKTALSDSLRSLAELCAAEGNKGQAQACFRSAVQAQPLNYLAWRGYAAFLNAHMPRDGRAWKLLANAVGKTLAPRYPEMAAELMLAQIHPGLHRACPSSADRKECYSTFWRAVQGMGPDRWAVEALCNSQSGSLRDGKRSDDEAILDFYRMVLGHTAGKPAYAPVILSWGNGVAAKMGEKMQKKFLKATLTCLSKGGSSIDTAARDRMLGQAILGAERMRDRSSFQAIGKLLSERYHKNRLPGWEPFPGKLVSRGGLLSTSSTCQHDDPAEHWGVLEPTGGRFHTGSDKDAWAVVELPKMANISGVVTIAPDVNLWRLTNMKVQYSETGRDGDWHEAGAMPNPTGQRVNRLDLQENMPRARFIRVLRPGGPEVFHLNAIFVYGKPAS